MTRSTRKMSRLVRLVALAAVAAGVSWTAAHLTATAEPAAAPAPAPAAAPAAGATATASLGTLDGNWPAFHGGGALRGEAKALPDGPLQPRWTYKTEDEEGATAGIEGSAAIVGDAVYVGDGKGVLHAIDLKTGQKRWTYKGQDGIAATPLVVEGRVLFGDLGGMFHCVSAANGQKHWAFDAGASVHAPANAAGSGPNARIIFGTDGADIF